MNLLSIILTETAISAVPISATKVILDNDWSTAGFIPYLLALNAGWDVLGLVGDTSNSWALQTSLHALATLDVGNLSSCIPVYKGSDYPLLNTPELFRAWEEIHGVLPWEGAFAAQNVTAENDGSDPTSGNPDRVVKEAFLEGYPNTTLAGYHAASWMVEQVHKYPGEVMIYSGGALTNIALAIRMDHSFASLAKGLVIMGGYIDVNLFEVTGSVAQADMNSDINLMIDPEASKIALTANFPNISESRGRRLRTSETNNLVAIVGNSANQVYPTEAYWKDVYTIQNPYSTLAYNFYGASFPFWDETAIFAVLDPANVLNSTSFYLDVDTAWSSPSYGNIHAYQEALMPKRQVLQKVNYVLEVDGPKLMSEIKHALQHPKTCADIS